MSLVLSSLLLGVVSMGGGVDVDRPEDLSFSDALVQGNASGLFRSRYEDVSGSSGKSAQGATYAVRAGYETERYLFLSAYLEYTAVNNYGGQDNFFDGSNQEFDDALIADPDRSFLSQYSIAYDLANTLLRYGRQNHTLDNGRFFGADNFRQGGSQVRGVTLKNESLNFLTVSLGHLTHFDSIYGDTRREASPDIRANYFNARYAGIMHSDLSLYSYDIESEGVDKTWGTQTDGVRFSGDIRSDFRFSYAFEFARQTDAGSNPRRYSTNYHVIELGAGYNELMFSVGHERLGAKASGYFVSPLASQHEFQGWTDVFTNGGLGNIDSGISDRYAKFEYDTGEMRFDLIYHDYEADFKRNRLDALGEEWNIGATFKWAYFEIGARYADYHAIDYGDNTRKTWFDLSARF